MEIDDKNMATPVNISHSWDRNEDPRNTKQQPVRAKSVLVWARQIKVNLLGTRIAVIICWQFLNQHVQQAA